MEHNAHNLYLFVKNTSELYHGPGGRAELESTLSDAMRAGDHSVTVEVAASEFLSIVNHGADLYAKEFAHDPDRATFSQADRVSVAEYLAREWHTEYWIHNPPTSVTLIGRIWRDSYGNSYYTCNAIVDGVLRYQTPRSCGYGDQYERDTWEALATLGIVPHGERYPHGGHEAPWIVAQGNGIRYHRELIPVARKRNL